MNRKLCKYIHSVSMWFSLYSAVNLQLDAETTTCAEGIEIVDQRVCPQQGFVCMTNTGALVWTTSIATAPDITLHVIGGTLNVPAPIVSANDGTELFVTALTADDSSVRWPICPFPAADLYFSNFLLSTSYFHLPTNYFLFPTSSFLLPTSYFFQLLPSFSDFIYIIQ